MKKAFLLLIIFVLLLSLQSFASEDASVPDSDNLKSMADLMFSSGDYETSIMIYYIAYLQGQIKREEASKAIQEARKNVNDEDYEPAYYSMTEKGNPEKPNIYTTPGGTMEFDNEKYDVYMCIFSNPSGQKITLNYTSTDITAININDSQIDALSPAADIDHEQFHKAEEKMIVDETIYPDASLNFIMLFPEQEGYKGIYIDPIEYEDGSEETVYIDFMNGSSGDN
ncbi:MAG: hypothetical protein ACLFT6_03855 [Bacteroidales bacterium]